MFNKSLSNISLANDIAHDIFPNIYGDWHNNDETFVATLRALLAPRISKDDVIRFKNINLSRNTMSIEDYMSNYFENNTILVCGLSGTETFINGYMASVREYFESKTQYNELKDLNAFVSKQADVRFYINEETKSAVIFVHGMNLRLYHYIQSFISRLLPWYFKDKPLTDQERELVKSLIIKDSSRYEELIEEFAEKYDFRTRRIEKLLNGFELAAKRQRLRRTEESLSNIERQIRNNIDSYRNLINQRTRSMLEKDGLQAQINAGSSSGSEILDYFICNKHLDIVSAYNTNMDFIVSCYLENYDLEMYDRISNNFNSYIYTDSYPTNEDFMDVHVRKKFLDAIFSDDPLLKIKMCAFYTINLDGYVETISGYDYPDSYRNLIPNPHLQIHACLGDQRPLIEECLRNGDYIAAIEQCVCSAQSVNVGESATFPRFLRNIFDECAASIIELPDGTSCTPSEALKWLEEHEKDMEEE